MTNLREQFANGITWRTTLTASVGTSETTFTLATVVGLPATGQIRMLFGGNPANEKVLIALNGTTTVSVTRAIEGSPLQSHTTAESLTPIVTAAALRNLADQIRQSIVVHDGEVVTHNGEVVWH